MPAIATYDRRVFSSRLDWELPTNALSRLLDLKTARGARVLDLTVSNPTRADLDYDSGRILSALADERALIHEPSARGLATARGAVSEYYAGRGVPVPPERILLTASTSEAYAYLFKLLADPGDVILVPRPSYPLFEYLARLEGVDARPYPLRYHHGWWVDFDALGAAADRRTRAVVVVNPNNPTGSFLKRSEADALAAFCQQRELAVICDEVFSDYTFGPDPDRVTTLAGREECQVFSLSGLSKLVGLPQMKLGWIVTSGPRPLLEAALARLELIADTYLSVGAPVQHAAASLLAGMGRFQRSLARRLNANLEFLRASGADILDVDGGWYAVLRAPRTRSEEQWTLELLEDGDVLVQPGFYYDFDSEAFLVVSLLTPPATFREGVDRMLSRLTGC